MLTRFEHLAANSMLGTAEAPPRDNGALQFDRDWERRAFGLAIALAKDGHFEWEDFRQQLIAVIGEWEASHQLDDPGWDYYQRWLETLLRTVGRSGLLGAAEIEERAAALSPGSCGSPSPAPPGPDSGQ
jgi:nitrile hydratase accessory protein